jgi:hypothetical protein
MTTSRGKILQEKTSAGLAWFLMPAKVVLTGVVMPLFLGHKPRPKSYRVITSQGKFRNEDAFRHVLLDLLAGPLSVASLFASASGFHKWP